MEYMEYTTIGLIIDRQQTAVEWYSEQTLANLEEFQSGKITHDGFLKNQESILKKAKEIERVKIDNLPIRMHEGVRNLCVYIKNGIVHIEKNIKD